jgi:undecaprenyl diphosphate synthase
MRVFIRSDLDELVRENVRLRIIGDYRRFSADLVEMIDNAVARTSANTGAILAVALNYGSQAEIASIARHFAEAAQRGEIDPAAIDANMIEAALDTRDLPPLDLLIRTSGEVRLSNFLLWQAAYAELLFTETLWPDFDGDTLAEAVATFGQRQRRFGGL